MRDFPPEGSPEGRTFRPMNLSELCQAVDLAFDYRGDVTLELTSGETVEGYLFNRDAAADPPILRVFPQGESGVRLIHYSDIAAIVLSGEDPASGKSWEAWVRKKETERKADAARVEAGARARGHL
jgi:hypothetical protein